MPRGIYQRKPKSKQTKETTYRALDQQITMMLVYLNYIRKTLTKIQKDISNG